MRFFVFERDNAEWGKSRLVLDCFVTIVVGMYWQTPDRYWKKIFQLSSLTKSQTFTRVRGRTSTFWFCRNLTCLSSALRMGKRMNQYISPNFHRSSWALIFCIFFLPWCVYLVSVKKASCATGVCLYHAWIWDIDQGFFESRTNSWSVCLRILFICREMQRDAFQTRFCSALLIWELAHFPVCLFHSMTSSDAQRCASLCITELSALQAVFTSFMRKLSPNIITM